MSIIWLDLETTGLDEEKDAILEIAWARADVSYPGKPVEKWEHVLQFPSGVSFHERVVRMHTENSLLRDCLSSPLSVAEVERFVLSELDKNALPEGGHTLAGNSVHFDLRFLKRHMPTLASRFSHRLLDLSAVKLFLRSIGVDLPKADGESNHRAMNDVFASMAEYRALATLTTSAFKGRTSVPEVFGNFVADKNSQGPYWKGLDGSECGVIGTPAPPPEEERGHVGEILLNRDF